VVAAAACHKDPVVTTRTVTAYVPQACPVDGNGYAEYDAYGDFDPPAKPVTGHLLSSIGLPLTEVYDATRELVVTVTESGAGWAGVAPVADTGDVNVLVLPAFASCPLTTTVGPRAGTAMGAIGGGRLLVVGGDAGPGQTPTTYVAHLDTGEVDPVSPELLNPRTDATVTPFGDGALVAGGTSLDDGHPIDTAEVYLPSGGFDQQNPPIQLDERRTKHGAVVLVGGQTLLVGGVGEDGTTVLSSLETIDPTPPHAVNEGGLGRLATARSNPTVLRLASGEILVAGGFDGSGQPVQTLEWFAPDATPEPTKKQTGPLAQGSKRAFIALEGGGALAVVTPPDGTPECPAGCKDASCGCFQNVWVIDATGAPEPGTLIASELPDPALFGGAGGAPVLWTGARWLQWQPYAGAFGPLTELDTAPAVVGPARCSPDRGLALWLDDTTTALTLLRFDTRNAYSSLPGPLLVQSADQTSPDRFGAVAWSSTVEGLVLGPGSPGGAAFVTDRTYADVSVDVDAPTGEPALVALRDEQGHELDVGGQDCPTPAATSHVHVERRGQDVTWSVDGAAGAGGSCPATSTSAIAATARVSVGVRGVGSTRSVSSNLVVTRLGSP
jgi:hypothetical protein